MRQTSNPTHQKASKTTRRSFLNRTGVFAGTAMFPWIIPGKTGGADGSPAPSERLTLGLIGHGVMGRGHLRRLIYDPEIQVLGVCDVDRSRCEAAKLDVENAYAARRAKGTFQGCTAYDDYQDLLARSDLDAVVIATPDHWHTPLAMDAAKAGKDIYCEKPISIAVKEGRQLEQTVSRAGRIFQTGTQYRSISTIRQVCGFVRAGGLGRVKSVFTLWTTLAGMIGSQRFKPYAEFLNVETSSRSYVPLDFSLPAESVPEGLNWQRWVGPAPTHPYNRLYHTNPAPGVVPWSFHRDFGAASVTWHHSHSADVIQYALGMERSGPVEFIHPKDGPYPTLTCRYANGTLLHLVENWRDVKRLYQAVPESARLAGNFGGVFVGERGWVTSMTTGGQIEGGPEDMFAAMKLKTREVSPGDNNHHANWFECIRKRARPSTDAEIGHRSASLGHLTIITHRLRRSLKWDPDKETFPGDEEANRLLLRPKRT